MYESFNVLSFAVQYSHTGQRIPFNCTVHQAARVLMWEDNVWKSRGLPLPLRKLLERTSEKQDFVRVPQRLANHTVAQENFPRALLHELLVCTVLRRHLKFECLLATTAGSRNYQYSL